MNTGDSSRSINSIQCRWRDIQKACAKWSGYLNSVEALNQSGQIDADRIPSTFISLEADDTPIITRSGNPNDGSVDSPRKRPPGKRKEKKAIRKRDSKICDLLEQFTKTVVEKNTIKAEKFEKITELKERKVKSLEEMTSIERREIEIKERKNEIEIMKMNLPDIDNPRLKTYYCMLQNKILSKMLARQDAEAYHPSLDDD